MNCLRLLTCLLLICTGASSGFGESYGIPQLVGQVPTGNAHGQIGYSLGHDGGLLSAPQSFFFDKNNLIVVDVVNSRLSFFDPEKLAIRDIVRTQDLRNSVQATTDGTTTWIVHNGYLSILDPGFRETKLLPFSSTRGFLSNGLFWFRNTESGKMECYDITGVKHTGKNAQALLSGLNERLPSRIQDDPSIRMRIDSIVTSGKVLLANGVAYTDNFQLARDYYRIYENTELGRSPTDEDDGRPENIMEAPVFVSVSKDGTSCWEVDGNESQTLYYVIISPFGRELAYFGIDSINPRTIRRSLLAEGKEPSFDSFNDPVAVFDDHNNLWFMIGYPTHIEFYKASVTGSR